MPDPTITLPTFFRLLNCDGTSGELLLEQEMAQLFARAFTIWKDRQRKYGCGNIAKRGPTGILVRLDDKLARLERVISGKAAPDSSDETLQDTCLDIMNYAGMVYLTHIGKWPGWPHD